MMSTLMTLAKRWLDRVRGLPASGRWYLGGTIAGAASLTVVLVSRNVDAASPFVYSFLVLYAAGFLAWAVPTARSVWRSTWGKVAVSGVNAVALLVTTLAARLAVSSALGLPPQDFDLTVHCVTVLIYVPVLTTLCALSVIVAAVVAGAFVAVARAMRWQVRFGDHAGGALAFATLVIAINVSILAMNIPFAAAVRWIAFVADFQYAPRYAAAYQGIDPGARLRLHENGVISLAMVERGDVIIKVQRLP